MAKKKRPPPQERRTPPGTPDDAFTARVLEFTAWAQERTHVLVIGVVAVVLLVVGFIFWMDQRSQRLERAAIELEQVQQAAFFEEAGAARAQLRTYLDRFGGTPYAVEARLLLAELLLEDGAPDEAARVLEEVAPSHRNPLRIQATILLGVAYEQAERWDEAADVYDGLRRNADFSFQRRDAAERLAQVRAIQGDTAAAVEVLEAVLDGLEEDDPQHGYFQMRIIELTGS
jgi:predicted negative regulator of RcsB-dependent stress response